MSLSEVPWIIPDLLAEEACLHFDVKSLKQTLAFAFASGAPPKAFEDICSSVRLPHSTWNASSFVHDLLLEDTIARCFVARTSERTFALHAGFLSNVLAHPPSDVGDLEFRRAVTRELCQSSSVRSQFEGIFASLSGFRALLETAPLYRRFHSARRKLDLLVTLKSVLDQISGSFEGCTSGLARLRGFAEEVRGSDAYRNLAQVLDFEDNLAVVDLRLRIGFDGRIRSTETLSVRENAENPHRAHPLRRMFERLFFWLRGYRFSEEEILARLIEQLFESLEDAVVLLFQIFFDMQLYFVALSLQDQARARGLSTSMPTWSIAPSDAPCLLRGLWNPLLASLSSHVVPCDVIELAATTIHVVTGPNSGGKTRLLQSVALVQVLAQGGLCVPAEEASLPLVPALFVSLLQETKIDQTEGRLGTELLRIRSLFEQLPPGGMVVMDELCSGTNPGEGEEMFELVLELLRELRPHAYVSTHFLKLAQELERRELSAAARGDVRFMQVELDLQQAPTYRFVSGVALSSLAHRTAERLGVTREQLSQLVQRSLVQRSPLGSTTTHVRTPGARS